MKKLLIILLSVIILPLNANAAAISESFNVGDRVTVLIENDNEESSFHVLKNSPAGEQYVWLLYEGNVGYIDEASIRHEITVYDQTLPGEHEASGNLNDTNEYAYKVLVKGTENWRTAEPVRLLTINDLTAIGITQENGKYSINANPNRRFLAPLKPASPIPGLTNQQSGYNYWTQSCVNNVCEGDNVSMYVVTFNESFNGDSLQSVATLEEVNISDIMTSPEFVIRPVALVDKALITCNFSTTSTTIASPKTAEVSFPVQLLGVVTLAGIVYIIIRKKGVFNKI